MLCCSVFVMLAALSSNTPAASVALDNNFNPPSFAYPDFGTRTLLLPDGKFVQYFNVQTLTDQPGSGAIMRFLPDGSFDSSFSFTRDFPQVGAAAALPDGRLIVAAFQDIYGNAGNEYILRLNTDGSIDSTFSAPVTPALLVGNFRASAIQPDGKILLAGFFTNFGGLGRQGLVRLNGDGTLDPNFAAITLQFDNTSFAGGANGLWAEPTLQSDGKIIIAGDFVAVNDVARPGVARLNADGTLDTTFNPSGFIRTGTSPIRGAVVQSDGNIVIGGKFTVPANFTANPTGLEYTQLPNIRLNATDGTVDQTYGCFTDLTVNGIGFLKMRDALIQSDDKVIMIDTSIFRFNTDGTLDSTFRQPVLLIDRGLDPNSLPEAFTLNLQGDGKVLFGGGFTDIDDATGPANGVRFGVGRVNSDGTLDTGFLMSDKSGYNISPISFARQPDGTTVIAFNAASFSLLPPEAAIPHGFGRLLSNGTHDAAFDPLAAQTRISYATAFAQLGDGSLVVQGTDADSGNIKAFRVLADGTLDLSFAHNGNQNIYTPDIASSLLQADGKLIAVILDLSANPNATNRTDLAGVASGNLLERFLPDSTFDANYRVDSQVTADMVQRDSSTQQVTTISITAKLLATYADGRVLLGYLTTNNTWRLVRLTSSGAIDPTFQAGSVPAVNVTTTITPFTDPVTGVATAASRLSQVVPDRGFADAQLLTNGQIIVAGNFLSYGSSASNGIVRLNSDGTVDASFQAGAGAQWTQTTQTGTFHPSIDNIEIENDGKFLITGTFEAFNGTAARGIASLNPNGSVDATFSVPLVRNKFDPNNAFLARQPDGSFLLSGPYTSPNQAISPSFFHLNSFGGIPIVGSPTVANATVGQSFTYNIVASGQPTSYSAIGLPSGFTINSATGVISGSGLAQFVGSYHVTLTATNSLGTSTTRSLELNINPAPTPPTPPANDNFANGQAISGIGGTIQGANINGTAAATKEAGEPNHAGDPGGASVWYVWTAPADRTFFFNTNGSNFDTLLAVYTGNSVGSLVEVVSNHAGDGTSKVEFVAVKGTVYHIAVDGAAGATGNIQLDWGIPIVASTNPIITSPLEAEGVVGQQFVYQIVANNSPTSYDAFNLPPGLTFDPTTGVIGGIPTQAGSTSVEISAIGSSSTGSDTLTINIDPAPSAGPVITSATSATGRTGTFFSFQVLASGLTSAARASASGLPPGLAIDDVSGLISGTPIEDGSFEVFVAIVDGSNTAVETLELTFTSNPAIPVIVSPSTAPLTPGQFFTYTIVAPATTDPNDHTVFSIVGTLPAGLGLDPTTGVISGTPTARAQRIPNLTPLFKALSDTPVVGAVQLVASNSQGTATQPLNFVQPAPNPLANISTRMQVQTGANVMIGGFIVTGMEPKKVVIRALGPTLANFNVPNVLANPTIELHDGTGKLVTTDDNWGDLQKADLIAAGYAPPNNFESAILATLNPGNYTAIVRGFSGSTGVGLVEVYDLSQTSSSSTIVNISTRGQVQTGSNVMIGGFIVGPSGTGTANVLVRALGPTLTEFGVPGALADPTLEIHDGTGNIISSNNNWKDTQQSQIEATGMAPPHDTESAIVASLTPGNYTAIVRGNGGSTGVALVEVYALH
jgi:uncharacterized delta-60 repeat protein